LKSEYVISIITVCYNAEDSIVRTIESVLSQKYNGYEYVVIDGSSSDSTNSIIQKYKRCINTIISEPDNGIYDAMNKGIKKAKGQYIYFLNAGDVFIHDRVLHLIGNELHESKVKLLFGKGFHFSRDTGKIGLIDYSSF
jgi:glycosyltransferase involved in cell wall biosynthesis